MIGSIALILKYEFLCGFSMQYRLDGHRVRYNLQIIQERVTYQAHMQGVVIGEKLSPYKSGFKGEAVATTIFYFELFSPLQMKL